MNEDKVKIKELRKSLKEVMEFVYKTYGRFGEDQEWDRIKDRAFKALGK